MSINTMPIGKHRGKNMDDVEPELLMELFQEYDTLKNLSESQKIIYGYVLQNYDELNQKIELNEENKHNESYELEDEIY